MRCTCPEDWQGMDHTSGCKARARRERESYLRDVLMGQRQYNPDDVDDPPSRIPHEH